MDHTLTEKTPHLIARYLCYLDQPSRVYIHADDERVPRLVDRSSLERPGVFRVGHVESREGLHDLSSGAGLARITPSQKDREVLEYQITVAVEQFIFGIRIGLYDVYGPR